MPRARPRGKSPPSRWSRLPPRLPRFVGDPAEVLDDARAHRFEDGEELVADARAEKTGVGVRRVDRVGDAMAAEVGVDVRAPRTEEGANAIACEGGEDSEAGGSGATEEPEEEGLGAILGMMAGRDAVCPGGTGGGTKGVPAR